MVFAAQKIAKEDPNLAENIGLLLVVSEELDHIGMVVCLLQNILKIHGLLIVAKNLRYRLIFYLNHPFMRGRWK